MLFAYYLILFITADDYSIQYIRHEKYLTRYEQGEILNDNRYNPNMIFHFDLVDILGKTLPEDYVILNSTNGQFIPRRTYINKRVTDFIDMKIPYKCNDTKNVIDSEECIVPTWAVVLNTNHTFFNLDHQNNTSPLYLIENKLVGYSLRFLADETKFIFETWENVKYNPEAGLTKLWKRLKGNDIEQQKYIVLRQMYRDSTINPSVEPIYIFNWTKYRLMGKLEYIIDLNHYDEFTRTKKSFLDFISNVYALSLGVYKF